MKISRVTSSFLVLSLTCVLLFVVRVEMTEQSLGFGIVWNIFLAWIPLVAALIARRLQEHKKTAFFFMGSWLLFFPNAPYIITDLGHLQHLTPHLWWFDSVALFISALTGLLLGMYSIQLIHSVLQNYYNKLVAWIALGGCMVLAGFGIYLGRFSRLNSWDILSNPMHLAKTCYVSLHDPLAFKTTVLFGFVLSLMYIAYYTLFRIENGLEKVVK